MTAFMRDDLPYVLTGVLAVLIALFGIVGKRLQQRIVRLEMREKERINAQERKAFRRLIEMAYQHAWGPNGTVHAQDEWHNAFSALGNVRASNEIGYLIYLGNGKFSWTEAL